MKGANCWFTMLALCVEQRQTNQNHIPFNIRIIIHQLGFEIAVTPQWNSFADLSVDKPQTTEKWVNRSIHNFGTRLENYNQNSLFNVRRTEYFISNIDSQALLTANVKCCGQMDDYGNGCVQWQPSAGCQPNTKMQFDAKHFYFIFLHRKWIRISSEKKMNFLIQWMANDEIFVILVFDYLRKFSKRIRTGDSATEPDSNTSDTAVGTNNFFFISSMDFQWTFNGFQWTDSESNIKS